MKWIVTKFKRLEDAEDFAKWLRRQDKRYIYYSGIIDLIDNLYCVTYRVAGSLMYNTVLEELGKRIENDMV